MALDRLQINQSNCEFRSWYAINCSVISNTNYKTNKIARFQETLIYVKALLKGCLVLTGLCNEHVKLTLFGLGILPTYKDWGEGVKMVPPPNLAIRSQMRMKLDKDILWVEIFTNWQKFFVTSLKCDS